MLERAWLYWRVVATGFSFLVFGIGGLMLRAIVFPLLNMVVWKRDAQISIARTTIRLAFRSFIGLMNGLGVLRYEIIGLRRLERTGLLILANHPTLIDTVFLMAFVRNADCIVKGRLWKNPFTRGPVQAAGYINNDAGEALIADCIASLLKGNNLIIFPEGTRTPPDGDIQLKRGAANIAVRGVRDVTPVVINCQPLTLGKGEKWWQVPKERACFRIEVQEDIVIDRFIDNDASEAMAARRLTNYLQSYFTEEVRRA
ncbi:lysophospholipid acyltransferase family protein [Oxalicibacterium solurbis]|uniref:1-acyl-sn-glycerol-3-phosphate acyltransferase n=1 Tax=Oxalicibacterium solurbis TaxID=69280 RepID=A0A8J3AY41_9BURK|nr:lysophospholipid acyltransferase family protein [Oxalicibacterium solurbis]GGI54281.1 1-acyl-sn-glycerol-3-phosphate acyltransferase [Oxalicibacterium solurbis]